MPAIQADDGLTIHLRDQGAGPALVFVHGWMMSGAVWEPQIQEFSKTHRVIAPDLRGCGKSEARAGTYTMPRYAADLDQLLTRLNVRDATIVGWSMGGGITMEYLQRYGVGRVKAIGLVDFPPRLEEDASVADKVCHSLSSRRESFVDGFMRRMILRPERSDLVERLGSLAAACKTETACEMYRAMRPTGPVNAAPLPIPAYLAFPQNGWFSSALAAWKQRLPHHVAPAFSQSKHCPFLEEADLFNQTLRAFLDGRR